MLSINSIQIKIIHWCVKNATYCTDFPTLAAFNNQPWSTPSLLGLLVGMNCVPLSLGGHTRLHFNVIYENPKRNNID